MPSRAVGSSERSSSALDARLQRCLDPSGRHDLASLPDATGREQPAEAKQVRRPEAQTGVRQRPAIRAAAPFPSSDAKRLTGGVPHGNRAPRDFNIPRNQRLRTVRLWLESRYALARRRLRRSLLCTLPKRHDLAVLGDVFEKALAPTFIDDSLGLGHERAVCVLKRCSCPFVAAS